MRSACLALAVLTVMTAGASYAQESFFNKRFCTMGGGDRGGSGQPDCSYNTWEQCRASASGLGRYCSENPFWKPESNSQRTPRRRNTQQY